MVPAMGILQLLDDLPQAVTRPPAQLWSVLARSLGEQGATGRTALAWRWALTGACPSPVTLARAPAQPPDHRAILHEAEAIAELGEQGIDPGGQVMQARFVLEWLAGKIDALPLWNGGQKNLQVSGGAPHEPGRSEIEEVYFWALAGVESARRDDDPRQAGRLESLMETFLWLTGWNRTPPVDRHGHGTFDACPERDLPRVCNAAGQCLRDACAACRRAPCVTAAQPTKAS
jgi:hypothetical protein